MNYSVGRYVETVNLKFNRQCPPQGFFQAPGFEVSSQKISDLNCVFKLLFWRQRNTVHWSMNAEHGVCNLLSYLSKIVKTKEILIGNYLMVHLFSWFIFFSQWYRAAFCVSTSYSARATYPHCRTVLYSHVTVVSIYYHIRSSSAGNKHVLPYFSSVLPTCCMGVCVQCWVSCAFFFLMVRVSHNCLQATGGAQALGRGALLNISYWSKSQA